MKYLMKLLILIGFCKVESFTYFGMGNGYSFIVRKANRAFEEQVNDLEDVETRQIKQPVDHFDKKNNDAWTMKYYANFKYWQTGGPLYFFVGGNGEAGKAFLKIGLMYDLAKETQGAMFATEHRYYGESHTSDDLTYLDAKQAVADLARLIRCLQSKEKYKNSKIIMIGASYAGNLAVWLRLIFPKKAHFVIALSAPLQAVVDNEEYLVQVAKDYDDIAPAYCWKKIKERFEDFEDKLLYSYGIKQLKEEESICDDVDMNIPENQQFFIQCQLSIFMACAQGGITDILYSCEAFHDITKVKYLKNIFGDEVSLWNKDRKCFDYDLKNYLLAVKEKQLTKAWAYQMCSEFGQFPTTTSHKHPFPRMVPPEFYYLICSILFGSKYNEAKIAYGVKYTNFVFGGTEPNVTKAIFVSGGLDPWRDLGVKKKINDDTNYLDVPKASHSKVLLVADDDSEFIKNARSEIKEIVKIWLQKAKKNNNKSNK